MSERRTARATSAPPESAAERDVLVLLRDPAAALWSDPIAYAAFMASRGWTLPVRDRLAIREDGPPIRDAMRAPPVDRRDTAATQWAVENGVTMARWPLFADLHRLRAMGCYGSVE